MNLRWTADTGQMKGFLTLTFFTSLFSFLNTTNLPCVYHEGRNLSCSLGVSRQPSSSCLFCKHFTGTTCDELLMNKSHCTRSDRCELPIDGQYDDDILWAVLYPAIESNTTNCQQMILRYLVKPGPVRCLEAKVLNVTSLFVRWSKPYDFDNDGMAYKYKVIVETGQTKQEEIIESSKVCNQTRVVQLPTAESWMNANVTVTGRMEIGGFYGASTTTYISNQLPGVLQLTQEAATSNVPFIVIGVVLFFVIAALVIAWCYRNRKTIFKKVTITLPERSGEYIHQFGELLPADLKEPGLPKRESRDGSTPQNDSGHCSMETTDEDRPLVQDDGPPQGEPDSSPMRPSDPNSGKVLLALSPKLPSSNPEQASSSNSEQASATFSQAPDYGQWADNSGQDYWSDGSALSYDRWVPISEISRRSSHGSNLSFGQGYHDPQIGILGDCLPNAQTVKEKSQVSNDKLVPYEVKFQNPHSKCPHSQDRILGNGLISDDQMNLCDANGESENTDDRHLPCGLSLRQDSYISDDENEDIEANYSKIDASDNENSEILSLASSASMSLSCDIESISSYTDITLPSCDNQI